jgi:hypothetical protein
MHPLAQVGILHLFHPGAGGGLFLFHRRLGRQAAHDVLLHPAQPAARLGEHPVGIQDLLLFLVQLFGRQKVVDRDAQPADRLADAVDLGQRIVGDRVGDHDARLVQPDPALGRALLPRTAAEHHRLRCRPSQRTVVAAKGAKFGHLGQHHGHDLDGIDFVFREFARGLGLHHQDAQLFADALDRHAEERGEHLLPGLGHVAKALFRRRIGGVDRLAGARDAADKPLAQPHPGLVDGLLLQPLGRAKFQRLGIAEEIDRADLGPHADG